MRRSDFRPATVRLLFGMLALAAASACRGGEPSGLATRVVSEGAGPTATSAVPTLVARSTAISRAARGPAPGAPTEAPAPITHTTTLVTFPEGQRPLPGAWSADGTRLVAFVTKVEQSQPGTPQAVATDEPDAVLAWVWTVDAEKARPMAEFVDVQDRLDLADGMAAWLDDGTLVVARGQDSFVSAEGRPLRSIGSDRQVRHVEAAPDGPVVLAVGPGGAWIAGAGRDAGAIQGLPSTLDAWSWRPDGKMLALAGSDGGLYVVDPARPVAERVARIQAHPVGERFAAPRWLADGRILLADAVPVRLGATTSLDHRIVSPDGRAGASLAGRFGLAPGRRTPRDASGWVSADGTKVLYPEVLAVDREAAAARWWILDVATGERREAAVLSRPRWAPTGARLAELGPDGLQLWLPEPDVVRTLSLPGRRVVDFAWSPSGRWLALLDDAAGLWLAACDVQAGPTLVAEGVIAGRLPTFDRGDTRMAAAVMTDEGAPALALVAFGIARP